MGPLQRAGLMVCVLVTEYLAVSYLFDVEPLLSERGLAAALAYVGAIAPLGAVMLTTTLVAGGRRLPRVLVRVLRERGSSRLVPWLLSAHLLNAPLLLYASASITATEGGLSGAMLALWVASVCTMLVTALLVAIPPPALGQVLRELQGPLWVGALAGTAAWTAGIFSTQLWNFLSMGTMQLVAAMVGPFTDDLVYEPQQAIVGTPQFHVLISPECSGYEGIGLIAVFLAVYMWVDRKQLRFPQAYALLPIAALAVWIGNAARIALLIAVGTNLSPEVALGGFHSKAGWLLFCAIGLLAVGLARRSSFLSRPSDDADAASADEAIHDPNPTATYLMPLLVLIATKLITGLFTADFDGFYPVAVMTVAITLAVRRKFLPAPVWPPSWHAPVIGLCLYPIWLMMFPGVDPNEGQALADHLATLPPGIAAAWIVFRAAGSCITVPLAEELAFRGFLLRRLIDADFVHVDLRRWTPMAVLGSSLAFGVLHQAYLGGTVAGLAFALAQRARGRIADAVVAHMVVNVLIAADVLLRGSWHLWG